VTLIPFNKPYLSGSELEYIKQAVEQKQISGDGEFSRRCQRFFEREFGFEKALFTTSCTDALEMAALLCKGDGEPAEIILPSYTFVSCANAFALHGYTLKFADSEPTHPNISPESIEAMITPATKALLVVHYAGVACDMDRILQIAKRYNLALIEDVAHGPKSFHREKLLGTFGSLSAFSFHETKNISCGEGGMLGINAASMRDQAEIHWQKGTNRSAFSEGRVDKYSWVDLGSSFLGSDILAAYLWAQLEKFEEIQEKRLSHWIRYRDGLSQLATRGDVELPYVPDFASVNGHIFYILTDSIETRKKLLEYLNANGVNAVFHYVTLHDSPYFEKRNTGEKDLPNAKKFSETLLRLPLFYELTLEEQERIIGLVKQFYGITKGSGRVCEQVAHA